tara:strand:- start:1079 stop:1255 length:177 start_codon:yes stop_codon:yes gene_type:complete
MRALKEESIPRLGKKINQLKKRIERTKISGRTEKVLFRKMRIKKIKNKINELMKKRKN